VAIRLRTVNGVHVALCAAKTKHIQGDIYLDDAWHYAISQKYWRDYDEIDIVDDEYDRLVSSLEEECSS
jgi:hypothetical protein